MVSDIQVDHGEFLLIDLLGLLFLQLVDLLAKLLQERPWSFVRIPVANTDRKEILLVRSEVLAGFWQ